MINRKIVIAIIKLIKSNMLVEVLRTLEIAFLNHKGNHICVFYGFWQPVIVLINHRFSFNFFQNFANFLITNCPNIVDFISKLILNKFFPTIN